MSFGGPEMIVVLILVLVLFGGSQLPKLARNLGKAQKEFKDGIAEAGAPVEKAAKADAVMAAGSDEMRERLRQLQALKDDGLITDDEFATRKASILGEI